jgi:hypothetical protein
VLVAHTIGIDVLDLGTGLPYIGDMPARTSPTRIKRPRKLTPHVPIKALRIVRGWTLEQLSDALKEQTGLSPGKGTLSAIESSQRGISVDLMEALEAVYKLEPGMISTTYDAQRTKRKAVA